jgi:hypothetical protein
MFSSHRLSYPHADLRISLREVRARQRNPRPLQRLEGHGMPALRLKEIVQEIFHVRPGQRWFHRRTIIRQRRRRTLLRWRLPLPLNCSDAKVSAVAIRFGQRECVRQMPDFAHLAVCQQNLHDVEPDFHRRIFQQPQIIQRRARKPPSPGCVHRCCRARPIF